MYQIDLLVRFRVQEGRLDHVLDAFARQLPAVHREPGCLRYGVLSSAAGELMVLESWAGKSYLQAHEAGALFNTLISEISHDLAEAPVVSRLKQHVYGDPGKQALSAVRASSLQADTVASQSTTKECQS